MVQHPPERLESDRVVLRRPTTDDAALVADTLGANIEHLRGWMAWAPTVAVTEVEQVERLREVAQWWDEGTEYRYLILDPSQTELLGIAGLHRRIGVGALELGYWLAHDQVGRGCATVAARSLTDAALSLPDVDRVEIHCDETNTRSAAIPARLGFRLDRVEDKPAVAPLETGRNQVWIHP